MIELTMGEEKALGVFTKRCVVTGGTNTIQDDASGST